jgi:tetratricopeptide (TPR) repeat protein/SAM-dependent methyltransferase
MNRKDRRAAGKRGAGGGPFAPTTATGALAGNLFAAAVQHFRAGQIDAAERACRDVLTFDRNHVNALHLLGMIAFQAGRHQAALELVGKAVALDGRNADGHFNLAQVLRTLGQLDEAAAHLAKATELRHDYAAAHLNLADLHLQQGRLEDAVVRYRRALAFKPGQAEVHSNLGVALAGLGLWDEAATQYRQALTLKPDLVDVYRNLGRIVLAQGEPAEAVALARRALALRETDEVRALFVQCVKELPPANIDGDLRNLIARALSEGWSRPSELTALAGTLCAPGGAPDLAQLASDPLLRALLESAPVRNVELERLLTAVRTQLLSRAAAAPDGADDAFLGFFCALARQCFINEYVFACSDDEAAQVRQLQDALAAALGSGASIDILPLIAVAAYGPLHTLARADALLERPWPAAVGALLDQQVREPLLERGIRASIPALTSIDDDVSRAVQGQYEDMPYPRWLKAAPVGRPTTIDWYLRHQFPGAPIRSAAGAAGLDVLIAGCGTGQHAIETAQRFAGARVLAIDLSRTSLAYALRQTRALGLSNIDYAQADILALGSLGRTFDLIEAGGVLHHLRDWAQGWRVLLALLRPGGVMHVGLYSAYARADIRAARAFIAERGYGTTANDIRRCRQEFLGFEAGSPLADVSKYADFFTVSECRDLLFHVQEHQLTIPEIKAFLRENGPAFIGFTGAPAQDYRRRFPGAAAMADLDQWHWFETENPRAFTGMYQFWVQKP